VHVGDRKRVLLLAQIEDDELASGGVVGHASIIGPPMSQLERAAPTTSFLPLVSVISASG
jgi:hypothetical protein